MEEEKINYFEYNSGTRNQSFKIILVRNIYGFTGTKTNFILNILEETDQYGNRKSETVEEKIELTKEQTQQLYDFVGTNIDLFKSLAEKNTPENGLDTGTLHNMKIKSGDLELKVETAIRGKTEAEINMINELYTLIKSFDSSGEIELLKQEKNKQLNEWINKLKNDNSDFWHWYSGTYSSGIFNILEKLVKITNDSTLQNQYEVISTIGKYINDKDREGLISILDKIKLNIIIEDRKENNLEVVITENETNNYDKSKEDEMVNMLVEKVISLPDLIEFSLNQFIDNIDGKIMLRIATRVFKELSGKGVLLESKSPGIVGLPQNIVYIKKPSTAEVLSEERKNRFVYEKGDLQFADTQCEFCKFMTGDINVCEKYPNGKPEEIIKSEVRCEFLENK